MSERPYVGQFNMGDVVKYAAPKDDGERKARFVVAEDRGDRVLIRLQCGMAIQPTEVVANAEVEVVPYAPITVEALAERIKTEVLEDVGNGVVPPTVHSFSELHDYVDANCYGGTEAFWDNLPILSNEEVDESARGELFDLMNEAMEIVDVWIKSGGVAAGLQSKV